jgi:hypothetical protein
MANFLFNDALTSIVKGEIDYLNDTIKVALYTTAPDIDADTYRSDLTGEASGTGYTTGGVTLGTKTVTTDDTNNRTIADAADSQWTGLTTSFRYIVVYQSTGVDATSRLISCIDTGSTQTLTGGTYDITWPTSGVFNFSNV